MFQKIYTQYGRPVYRFLLALCADPDLAEELLQETFYQALLHIDKFEGRCSMYTWLCQIGKNAWLKEYRRRKRHADVPPEELRLADPSPGPEEAVIRRQQYEAVRQAIQKLPEPYKDVFILHHYGELKFREIAAAYRKSESWARVTYHRAKQQIIQEVRP